MPGRRRQQVLAVAVAGVSALALVGVLTTRGAPSAAAPDPVAAGFPDGNGLPPWPAPVDPAPGARAAGLGTAPAEGMVQHFHVHLDLLVEGEPVPVPPDLGIDVRRQVYAELHTHAATGVVHAEAADLGTRFTLGQLFTEWGVRLDAQHLGGLSTGDGRSLWAWVDGHRLAGDPAALVLADHQEIVLAYGTTPPRHVPATFDFVANPT